MRNSILAISLLALTGSASAAPSLIASVDARGGVNFEFVADKAAPIGAFIIELPLVAQKARTTVPEQCIKAPAGFSALCNVDNGVFKAIVYSTNPDAAIPSAILGRVALPLGSVTMNKSGEVTGLKLNGADSSAAPVVGEVLSEGPRNTPRGPVREE